MSNSSFYYTVSNDGIIEAFEWPPGVSEEELQDGPREVHTSADAAVTLAERRLEEAIERNTSITGRDRLMKYLGRLRGNPTEVLEAAQEKK